MMTLLNTHQITLPDIFKYAVVEPIYLNDQLIPVNDLHYLIVVYTPNKPTSYYIIKNV